MKPEDGDRYCPVFRCEIDGEICYESALCLGRHFKISSVPELAQALKGKDVSLAEKLCEECPHSNME